MTLEEKKRWIEEHVTGSIKVADDSIGAVLKDVARTPMRIHHAGAELLNPVSETRCSEEARTIYGGIRTGGTAGGAAIGAGAGFVTGGPAGAGAGFFAGAAAGTVGALAAGVNSAVCGFLG
jgi:hypothetical protein